MQDITSEAGNLLPDDEAVASYYYNSETRVLTSFDSVSVAEFKGRYISDEQLGGAMWWMAGGDEDGDNSRVKRVCHLFILFLSFYQYKQLLSEKPHSMLTKLILIF